jgi:MraZ protein
MRFLGHIEAKTDKKGRVFLPAIFRKEMQVAGEERLILRKDVFQPCLVLYPESVWNLQLDTLRNRLNRWNKKHQQIFRMFVSDVEPITLDGNGRFLIPKRYLKMANIQQEVRFIGMDDTIEIWCHSNEDQPFMDTTEFIKGLQDIMSDNENQISNTNGSLKKHLEEETPVQQVGEINP